MIVAGVEGNSEVVQFYLYDSVEGIFNKANNIKEIVVSSNLKVKNVIVIDIDKDGNFDLIVTSLNKNTNKSIVNEVYLGKSTTNEGEKVITFDLEFTINEEIFVANLLGDNLESIVFYSKEKKERMHYSYFEGKLAV